MSKHIVIIGAGLGGLSAAIHLAAAGQHVTVLERNAYVGGKAGQVEIDGYRWDTGPTVITLQPLLADLFAAAGCRLQDYLTLVPIDPLTRYHYPDSTVLDINVSLLCSTDASHYLSGDARRRSACAARPLFPFPIRDGAG
jgi:phytoene dehydrogenase-like protein